MVEGNSVKTVYRLNSLVDRASDNGVIAHLLTVAVLRRRDTNTHVVPGANVTIDGKPRELDVLGYQGEKVVAGEIKMSASEFSNEQIDRDVELPKKIGADMPSWLVLSLFPQRC